MRDHNNKARGFATRTALKTCCVGAVIAVLAANGAQSQDTSVQDITLPELAATEFEKPLSAIDWLSDTLDTPRPTLGTQEDGRGDIALSALPEDVSVAPLDAPKIDAVGLLPARQIGLPSDLWGASSGPDIARRIASVLSSTDLLPASRRLLNTLILAELDPPSGGSVKADGRLFVARIDALLEQGLIDEADALMERSGVPTPEIFRRLFDAKLLMGTENDACRLLRTTRGLSPNLPTQVFCLARGGDWDAAALTLETADVLGLIDDDISMLLARFLDPELFEGDPPLSPPLQPTPLTFRLLEAIGEHVPTLTLPLAFAQSDLRESAGWKTRATAAERLARVGAISPNRWLGIWSEHLPAASGGIWDRIEALQRFETALNTGDPGAVSHNLSAVWSEMGAAGLQIVFADLFAQRLADLPLTGEAADVAFEVALLSPAYETVAGNWPRTAANSTDTRSTGTKEQLFLKAVALGDLTSELPTQRPSGDLRRAIADGFRANGIPVRLTGLVRDGRLGEAILRAISLLEGGAQGDLDELSDAIQFFRAVGLEATARRAALEILLLERRG